MLIKADKIDKCIVMYQVGMGSIKIQSQVGDREGWKMVP